MAVARPEDASQGHLQAVFLVVNYLSKSEKDPAIRGDYKPINALKQKEYGGREGRREEVTGKLQESGDNPEGVNQLVDKRGGRVEILSLAQAAHEHELVGRTFRR